jgi:hypothetical protein
MSLFIKSARAFLAFAGIFTLSVPAVAQSEMNPPASIQNASASTSPENRAPTTSQLNRASNYVSARRAYRHRMQRGARFQADRQAYMSAMRAHHRAVNRYDRRYIRQQMAYADAMATWRNQVRACRHGNRHACRAPTPRVENFY